MPIRDASLNNIEFAQILVERFTEFKHIPAGRVRSHWARSWMLWDNSVGSGSAKQLPTCRVSSCRLISAILYTWYSDGKKPVAALGTGERVSGGPVKTGYESMPLRFHGIASALFRHFMFMSLGYDFIARIISTGTHMCLLSDFWILNPASFKACCT